MELEAKKYLDDIAHAIRLTLGFVADHTLDDYLANALLRSAVERQLEIAGEAVSPLARLAPQIAEHLSNYRQIISFRNVLVHGYAKVDDRIVWDVVTTRLKTLLAETEALLQGRDTRE